MNPNVKIGFPMILPLQYPNTKGWRARAVFCRSGETAAVADYFLAVRTYAERNARFAYDLAQSLCTLHNHEAFALSQHVLRPNS